MSAAPVLQNPAAPPLTTTVGHIQPLAALASEVGISLVDILRELALSPLLLQGNESQPLKLADYFRILEKLALAAHDETCRLSTRPLMPGTTHFVLSNLSGCANLFEAMKLMARSYNLLHGGQYNHVEKRGDFLVYLIDDSEFPYTVDHNSRYIHFTMECVLIFLHGMLSFISADRLSARLKKIYSKRPQRDNDSGHLSFWHAPIRYGCSSYALFYDIAATTTPVAFSGDEPPSAKTIYNKVVAMIEEQPYASGAERDVVKRVKEALWQGLYDQSSIARQLGFSLATLRRRLSEENVNFRRLRAQVFNELAKSLLAQHWSAYDIAEALGFSDFRSFIRAFKSWNGLTPNAYAKAMAASKSDRPRTQGGGEHSTVSENVHL